MFFTKIQIEGLSQTFERTGYPYFNHLDNGAGAETSLETARAASRGVRQDIAAGGFVAHPEKCCWEPTQVGQLLDFILKRRHQPSSTPMYRKTEG